jgi:hypothetical protein
VQFLGHRFEIGKLTQFHRLDIHITFHVMSTYRT